MNSNIVTNNRNLKHDIKCFIRYKNYTIFLFLSNFPTSHPLFLSKKKNSSFPNENNI